MAADGRTAAYGASVMLRKRRADCPDEEPSDLWTQPPEFPGRGRVSGRRRENRDEEVAFMCVDHSVQRAGRGGQLGRGEHQGGRVQGEMTSRGGSEGLGAGRGWARVQGGGVFCG